MPRKSLTFLLCLISAFASAQTVSDTICTLVPRSNQVYRHGYQQLTPNDRALYDTIVDAFLRFEPNGYQNYLYHRVTFPSHVEVMNGQNLATHIRRILSDIPELFIISSSAPGYDWDNYVYFGKVGFYNTPESYLSELRQIEQIYDSFASAFTPGMTDYQRLLILHDAFINWGDYGDITGADAGNLRGALINRRAICEGFARAGLYMCQRAGIECIFVTGQLHTSTVNDTWTSHAWNYVRLNGQWYLMDLTTDGGFPNICGHSAFLKGQDYLNENYRLLNSTGTDPNEAIYGTLPTLSATDYDPNAIIPEPEPDPTPDPTPEPEPTPDPTPAPTPDPIDNPESLDNSGITLLRHSILRNGQLLFVIHGNTYDIQGHLIRP